MFSFFLDVPTSFPITLAPKGVSHWKGTGLSGEKAMQTERLREREPESPVPSQ